MCSFNTYRKGRGLCIHGNTPPTATSLARTMSSWSTNSEWATMVFMATTNWACSVIFMEEREVLV